MLPNEPPAILSKSQLSSFISCPSLACCMDNYEDVAEYLFVLFGSLEDTYETKEMKRPVHMNC